MPRITPDELRQRRLNNYIPVPESGCWLWLGGWTMFGHGRINCHGKYVDMAHRYVYEHFNGPIPDGMFVMHKCDTPACVNPNHLTIGSHGDNMRDMFRKGRAKPFFGAESRAERGD